VHKSTIQTNGQSGQTAKLCFQLLSLKAAFLKAQQNNNSLVGKPFVELQLHHLFRLKGKQSVTIVLG
jgi:hypothetical protein